ncbi:MAG: carboxypeptidase-like regulatory domain-containing protein [Chitinophagaceae bacterium]
MTGKVLSAKDKTPLPAAAVHISGSSRSVTTGDDGSFIIPANTGSTLNFSMVGYLPKVIKITNSKLGIIVMTGFLCVVRT